MIFKLTTYRSKEIYAYLSPVTVESGAIKRDGFYNGEPPKDDAENKDNFYRGKAAVVEFDLNKFDDGWYEWKEAKGHKESRGFIKIEAGEICDRCNSPEQLINILDPIEPLPMLQGSSDQIRWAKSIREKAVRSGVVSMAIARAIGDAKTWIDHKDNLQSLGEMT